MDRKSPGGLDGLKKGVTIEVHDRSEQSQINLPEEFFGRVELCFRRGELVNVHQTETRTKAELRGKNGTRMSRG